MTLIDSHRPSSKHLIATFVFPAVFLCFAYGLLALTLVQNPGDLMSRCVLMNLNLARIWSVAHIEIGMSYIGVFIGMAYYLIRAGNVDQTHFRDLGLGFAYLIVSFFIDYYCVRTFTPFHALLVGDAVVMTFTLLVSKQLWFQRLLGVFVPLVFFTCAIGHLMEGLSFWKLTYPVNVPWTMVTADIGFAILVNATRFPAFIRGHEIENDIAEIKLQAKKQQEFLIKVLSAVTDGRMVLAIDEADLPQHLVEKSGKLKLSPESLSSVRCAAKDMWNELGFPDDREPDMQIAVGESIMNAVVHGKGGYAQLFANDDTYQVWVTDFGPGIHLDRLPQATLERGYSTAGSLGHGFWIILQTVDRLVIRTNAEGTVIVLSFSKLSASRDFSFLK